MDWGLTKGICGLGAEYDREVQVETHAGSGDSPARHRKRSVEVAELGKWLCGTRLRWNAR